MFSVPVPPVCIRPTVSMGDKGTREDDLTAARREGEVLKWLWLKKPVTKMEPW